MPAVTPAYVCKRALLCAVLLTSTAVAATPQTALQPVGDPVEAVLVRQDFSDCQNGNVDPNPIEPGGVAVLQRLNDGTTGVKVAITAKPNTKYHFFLKCVRILGDIQTGDEGTGEALFTFRTNEIGNVIAFDMYPEGAPAGNKYQSAQVKMQ
jgi:hypothetical protein